MDRTLDIVENGYTKLCILGDLNGWIVDRTRLAYPVLLKFQERKIMVEDWWSFAKHIFQAQKFT